MGNDPLAPFRRGPQPSPADQVRHSLTEHEALRLAIAALNEVPNSRVRMGEYANTYQLIPVIESIKFITGEKLDDILSAHKAGR